MNIYKRRFINYWNGRKNSPTPLHFVNKGSTNATIGWYTKTDDPKTIKYSTDNENWTSISSTGDMATLAPNEVLYVKGTNSGYGDNTSDTPAHFTMTGGEISVEGNIMALINEDNFISLRTFNSNYTFEGLFQDCTSLKYADKLELPATTLTSDCYSKMFKGCTSLTAAPELPATNIHLRCYLSMFSDCTSLTTAPELPATTLTYTVPTDHGSITFGANACYANMFDGCTSLTTTPELPATTLAPDCYWDMFIGCTALTTAPELPATVLKPNCYAAMFALCGSLTSAPELPATALQSNCYASMFSACSTLNEVKLHAADISATGCLNNWLHNTASSGTVYYETNSITLPTDSDSGIPTGWTGKDINSLT